MLEKRKEQLKGGVGIGVGVGKYFQVTGLGRREPGSGVQVRVQVQDLNFAPYLSPVPDNTYLRPEGWTKDSAKVQIGAELLCKSESNSGDG